MTLYSTGAHSPETTVHTSLTAGSGLGAYTCQNHCGRFRGHWDIGFSAWPRLPPLRSPHALERTVTFVGMRGGPLLVFASLATLVGCAPVPLSQRPTSTPTDSSQSTMVWSAPTSCPSVSALKKIPGWSKVPLRSLGNSPSSSGCDTYAAWGKDQASTTVRTSSDPDAARKLTQGFDPTETPMPYYGEGAVEIRYTGNNIRGEQFPRCVVQVPLVEPGRWLIVQAGGSPFDHIDACSSADRILRMVSTQTAK